jgi:hypothetical protein
MHCKTCCTPITPSTYTFTKWQCTSKGEKSQPYKLNQTTICSLDQISNVVAIAYHLNPTIKSDWFLHHLLHVTPITSAATYQNKKTTNSEVKMLGNLNWLNMPHSSFIAVPVQVWTGSEGSRRLRSPEAPKFQDNRHMKVVRLSALRTGRLYRQGNISGT